MSIAIVRLLFDFGLVVLIWMIQRIVYPSFLDYNTKNLIVWHQKYVKRLTPIVLPLMLGQLSIAIYQVSTSATLDTILSLAFILLIWTLTFWQFVPIHAAISKGTVNINMLNNLVTKNWVRTILWTLLFVYSSVMYL